MVRDTITKPLKKMTARLADKLRAASARVDDAYGELGELVQDVRVTIKKNYADIKRFLDRKKKPKDDAR